MKPTHCSQSYLPVASSTEVQYINIAHFFELHLKESECDWENNRKLLLMNYGKSSDIIDLC
ncbi:hypothetical protein C7H79_09500 [Nitrosomonas supralitoralis]|uniref:Uncharacterized protein n=1 Tax=Nitrosomonas supralitoralis TaxID=2116706 RepID=A0A2P7NUS4_9PROT|nr:hypothetical protein C7H79_09500 [Nitrosomonas supralitoralis]